MFISAGEKIPEDTFCWKDKEKKKKKVDKKIIIAYNRLHHEYDKNNEGNKQPLQGHAERDRLVKGQ